MLDFVLKYYWQLSLIYNLTGLLSIPVYVVFVVALFRERKKSPLNSAFYTLCRVLALPDLISLVGTVAMQVWQSRVVYPSSNWHTSRYGIIFIKVSVGVTWHATLSQHLGAVAFAVNRLTGVSLRVYYEELWERLMMPVVVLMYALPLVQSIPFFLFTGHSFYPIKHSSIPNETVYDVKLDQLKFVIALNILTPLLTALVCPVIYCIIFRKVIASHRTAMELHERKRMTAEINMTISAVSIFGVLCLFVITYINFAIQYNNNYMEGVWVARLLMFGSSCLYSFINPYVVLLCSKATRSAVRRMLNFE